MLHTLPPASEQPQSSNGAKYNSDTSFQLILQGSIDCSMYFGLPGFLECHKYRYT